MNMAASFAPSFNDSRPVAQHCSELTERGPRPEERAQNISAWCRDLGYELSQELSQLFSAGKLEVEVAAPEMIAGKEVFERIGPIAANNLLRCGRDDQTMLLSLDFATAIALTDCSFGGPGDMPGEAPAQLPRSAGLLIEKCAGIFAQVIAVSNGSAETAGGDVLVRSESVTRLKPFGVNDEVAVFEVKLTLGEATPWAILLTVPSDQLDAVLPGGGATMPARGDDALPSDGTNGPFAQMPLELEALLGEVSMTLAKLETLSPGDEIPLAMSRDLPLKLGEELVAHGMLGTLENRLALKITRLPSQSRTQAAAPTFADAFSASDTEPAPQDHGPEAPLQRNISEFEEHAA